MSDVFKPNAGNWIFYMREELSILNAFAIGTEKHILDSKENFKGSIEEEVIEIDKEEGIMQVVYHKDGLDDVTFHLESIFLSHFPNMHRQSVLITLYSFLENSLLVLCNRYKKELELKINLSDINGKGIGKYKKYLVKVVGLDLSEINAVWQHITNIQKIRNVIVHDRGYIKADNEEALNNVRQTPKFELVANKIEVLDGALLSVLDVFSEYFEGVNQAVIKFNGK